jgi:hypothetical protein
MFLPWQEGEAHRAHDHGGAGRWPARPGRPICDIEGVHYSTNLSLLRMLSYKLGRSVQWNGEKEACMNDGEANKLLR